MEGVIFGKVFFRFLKRVTYYIKVFNFFTKRMMRINYLHSGGHDQYVLNRFTEMEYNARFRNLPTTFVTSNPAPSNSTHNNNTYPSINTSSTAADPFSLGNDFDMNLMDVRRLQPVNSVQYAPTDRTSNGGPYSMDSISRRSKSHISLNDMKTMNGKKIQVLPFWCCSILGCRCSCI